MTAALRDSDRARQVDQNLGSLTEGAVAGNPAAVGFDNPFCNRQAEAGTPVVVHAGSGPVATPLRLHAHCA